MADEIRNCAELDERLTPYVDGADGDASRRAVAQHLNACPSCRDHAGQEIAARDAVREHRAALTERASDTLRARCRQSASSLQLPASGSRLSSAAKDTADKPAASWRKWLPLSMAATLVLAVAGVFVFGLNDRVEALAASLAVDHIKCFKVGDTSHDVQPATAEQKWQQDQGWAITVPPAEAAQQLKLVGVRRCFTTDGRSAHIMYTWRGAPLSVYVLPKQTDHDRIVTKMGTEAVIWCANQRTYAVVTDSKTEDVNQIVTYLKARVR